MTRSKVIAAAAAAVIMLSGSQVMASDSFDMDSFDQGSFDMDTSSMGSSFDSSSFDTSDFEKKFNEASSGKEFSSDFSKGAMEGFSSSSKSFDEMQKEVSEGMDTDMTLDKDGLSSQLKDVEMPELPELEMPDIDDLTLEISDSMKTTASSTLKSYMGTSFSDLGSSLYAMEKMPDVNFETLNVKYADLISGLEAKGYGQKAELVQPVLTSGPTSAMELFNESFGSLGLASGAKDYKLPSIDPSQLISGSLSERGKSIAENNLNNNSIYQIASQKINLQEGVAGAQAKVSSANKLINSNKTSSKGKKK